MLEGIPDPGDVDETLSELAQTHADTDQTASDDDAAAADVDREAALGEQMAANADQASSDADQASADRDLRDGGEAGSSREQVHRQSRSERADTADLRHATQQIRSESTDVRAASDARRHEVAVLRDDVAAERDRTAELRDRVTAQAEAALLAAHPGNTELREALAAHASLRAQVRSDRDHAARDRQRAAEDRVQAAIGRREARLDLDRATLDTTRTPANIGHSASNRIANRVVGLHKRYRGRGPQTVEVQCSEDVVTVVMRDGATRVETELHASGHSQAVEDQRQIYEQVMRPRLVEVAEEELGRSVDAFVSASHHEPELTVEIFVLARR